MKRIFTTVFLCAALYFHAQTGTVSGNINDNSKIALPGAKITLTPGNIYTVSDDFGNFIFLNVPNGQYTMKVDYLGYGTKEYNLKVESNQNTSQNIVFDPKEKEIQEVKLFGFNLQNQARALNKQKSNPNITNIISADQMGKFPDSNIGDALKRVPGITMQNDQGEARDIIIRGLSPELNSVTLNGNRIPSAEGDNRRVQMDLIPSDMIQLVEVNKTLTSDQDADAIGGSVELVTRSASDKERISLTTASGYNPIREKALVNTSFVYSNRFFDKKLGLVLNGSYNNNIYGSDNVEAVWAKDDAGNVYIEEMDIRKYDVRRERKSFGADLDFKFNEKNKIRFSAMYNWRDDWENRYRERIKKITPEYADADETIISGFKGRINRQTKGGINNNLNDNTRLERQIMQNYSVTGEHVLGSKLEMNWGASYSKASEKRPNERYISYEVKDVKFDKNFDSPEEPLLKPISPVALNKFKLQDLTDQNGHTFEEEITAKVNFRLPFSVIDGQKGRLRFGAKARLKTKERNNDFFSYKPTGSNMDTMDKTNTVFWSGENFNPNSKYEPGYFVSSEYLGNLDLHNTNVFKQSTEPSEYLFANYSADEKIYAGYLRWDQNFTDQLSMIVGVRLENTHTNYSGNVVEDEETLTSTRKLKNDYTNVLPSLAFKYTPVNNLVLRAAYSTALARPSYYKLSPFVGVIPDDRDITAGNPNLKSSFAHNFDVMGEYYFKSVGLFSIGGFYKKINDFIYDYRDQNFNHEKFGQIFPDLPNTLTPGDKYTFLQPKNGESVNVYGFEVGVQRQLDFLPGFLKNLGVYANYTYTKSKAKGIYNEDGDLREGIMLPGTAPHMFNASLSWENKKFSARVSLNHTASYLDTLGGSDFEDRFYDKQTFLDANVSYSVNSWIRIFVEANNLTNQPLRYYQGVASRTMQMEYYKPRFTAGLKFDF
ncbi:TonB-dependent receptor [Amniculibacterium sp. G2-70]|uniref:TonB-dependent receptor n=1 Tax=Amniculibacterium sp. G2-70 TaxID=2767188 RepID=UPI0016541810|nr:TonB-dependent receptor [Amniculibacterium sp. G2-70]